MPQARTGTLGFVLALPASLLSSGYRDPSQHLVRAAAITGLLELLLGASTFLVRILTHHTSLRYAVEAAIGRLDAVNVPVAYPLHSLGALDFVLSPAGLFWAFITLEGGVRSFLALACKEPRGLLAVWLIERAHEVVAIALGRAVDRLRSGPLVTDQVVRRGEALTIESCRRRRWRPDHTIEFEDALFELVGFEVRDQGPRRFVYDLRLAPTDCQVRHIHHYRPDELLTTRIEL